VAPTLHREAYPFEVRCVSATDREVGVMVRWHARVRSRVTGGLDAALVLDCHIAAPGETRVQVAMLLGA
jgi:hypothetical protein